VSKLPDGLLGAWNDSRAQRQGARSCYGCRHLSHEYESWEMPHIEWWECSVRSSAMHLRSFPFLNTKCGDHEPRTEAPK
jgi:hypothetical protein